MSGFHAEIDADGALRLVLPAFTGRIRSISKRRALEGGGAEPAGVFVELSDDEESALLAEIRRTGGPA